ncbi:MAG: two-component regulator propeller domain-containing protein, partial [Bacteroidota bacterium]
MKNRQFAITVLFTLGVYFWGYAQYSKVPATHQFEVFELPGNELGNHVQAIAQDSFGFMWFGSQNGLHRWDGYNFKTYQHDPKDSTTIASDYIETLYIGKDGTLWVGTWGAGVDRFDYQTQTFEHFRYHSDNPNSISNDFISDIVEDNAGSLWIATNLGLTRLNLESQEIRRYLPDSLEINSLSYEKCRVLYVDHSGELWIGTGYPWEMIGSGGLNRYRPDTDDFQVYLHDEQDPQSIGDNKIGSISEDSWGNFWIGTANAKLFRMDRDNGTFLDVEQDTSVYGQFTPASRPTHFDRVVKFVFEDQDRRLWSGVWHGGVRYLEPETGFSRAYYYDETDATSLPEPNPWQLFQSKDGTLWGSTAGMSARVFKIEKKLFDYYPVSDAQLITSFTETQSKEILLGTFNGGIKVFSSEDRTIKPLDLKVPTNPQEVQAFLKERSQGNFFLESWMNAIYEIIIDAEGWYWFRQPLNGAVRLHPQTGEVHFYQHQANNSRSLGKGWVTDIHLDQQKNVWLITSNGDLQRYNAESDDFELFAFYKEKPLETKMLETADGRFYLAGSSIIPEDRAMIIKTFDPQAKTFSKIPLQLKPAVYESPMVESILSILEGPDNTIWIGTEERILSVGKEDQKICEFNA